MHQNNKTFLPTPSAHFSKIILFFNAGFLAYVFNVKSILRYAIS
ncbi:hypothetical protein [Helicobacter pylori]|nr:hypothetical protein [Helicobacter pylori]